MSYFLTANRSQKSGAKQAAVAETDTTTTTSDNATKSDKEEKSETTVSVKKSCSLINV